MAKGYGTKSKSNIGLHTKMQSKDKKGFSNSTNTHATMRHENEIGVKARGFGYHPKDGHGGSDSHASEGIGSNL